MSFRSASRGGLLNILVLPGDGIGPEITAATLRMLHAIDTALGLRLVIEQVEIGLASLAREGSTLPERVLEAIPQADGVILGPVSHYDFPDRAAGGTTP